MKIQQINGELFEKTLEIEALSDRGNVELLDELLEIQDKCEAGNVYPVMITEKPDGTRLVYIPYMEAQSVPFTAYYIIVE